MPYLKSIPIHSTVNKSLEYILNPDKTEELLYCSSLNCLTNAQAAYLNMKYVYESFNRRYKYDEPMPINGKGHVKAIHYIQSFKPDEDITPEKAHKIAKAFARKTFGDDVQVVIATHVDKKHIHSHFIVNAYSITGRKYNDNLLTRNHAREYSDRVCLAFGIQPIIPKKGRHRTLKYNAWEKKRKGTTLKQRIRNDIDSLILSVRTFDDLLTELEKRGYTIKQGKRISVKASGAEHYMFLKTLGDDYTEQSLASRILWKDDMGLALYASENAEPSPLRDTYIITIDKLSRMIAAGKKVQHKRNATLPYLPSNDRDVYMISAQLSIINRDNIRSIEELESKIGTLKTEYEKAVKEVNALMVEKNKLDSLIEQSEQYIELAGKQQLTSSERLRLNMCRQTVSDNGITSRDDLTRLKLLQQEQDKKITALRNSFESCKKLYEVYTDIAATYRDISTGDYISKLMIAEKEKQEQERKARNITPDKNQNRKL